MGYKKNVFAGITWLGGARGVNRGLAFGKNILTARLLAPRDFGQFGALLLVISAFEIMTAFGFRQIVIQEKRTSSKFLSSIWTASLIRGGLIAFGVFFLSSLMARFFQDNTLTSLFSVIAIVPLIKGMVNPGMIIFQKNLDFGKEGILKTSVSSVEFITTVGAALVIHSVWALILGFFIATLSEVILSFMISRFRPRIRLNLAELRSILAKGKWLVSSSIFNYAATQGDDIFVGRLLGLQSLGFYQLAFKIANLPLTEISSVLTQVTFPIYTKIGRDVKRLRRAFLQTTLSTAVLGGMIAIFLIIFADPLVRIVLGEKWIPMVAPLRILAVFGFFRSLMVNTRPLFLAKGDFKTVAFFDAARTVILALLLFPLINRYQVSGASLAILASLVIAFPWLILKARKILGENNET